jgi:hypothetical protein
MSDVQALVMAQVQAFVGVAFPADEVRGHRQPLQIIQPRFNASAMGI